MYVERLTVDRFRNLRPQEVLFAPGVNVLLGRNGQGKTNLLEALYLLSMVRSFRTHRTAELIRWGETEAHVSATARDRVGTFGIALTLERTAKTAFLNGAKVKNMADFIGKLPCIAFVPSDLHIVRGAPSGRRQFLDKHLVDYTPSLFSSLVHYHRALKQKMALLKEETSSEMEIRSWNRVLAAEAVRLDKAKHEFVAALSDAARRLYERFTSTGETLDVRLLSDVKEWSDPDEVHRQFERVLPKEIRQRTSLLGPHRDDLLFLLNGQDARAFASQGQCRSIVLALKLGVMELLEKRWEDPPIILLDDVDAELDTVRSNRFFEMILNADRQVFISCTDAYRGILRSHQSSLVYRVDDGLYAPEKSCG